MRKHDEKRTAGWFVLASAAWLGVLFWFSGQSGADSGALSGGVTRWLFGGLIDRGMSFNVLHVFVRKLAHFGAFAVEGWLLGSALLRILPKGRAALRTGLLCAGIAVLNELHQTFSEGRSCEVRDMLIDTSGALLGFAFAVVVLHAFSNLHRRKGKK